MASAAQIFNPLYIKDMSEVDIIFFLHHLADKLVHFKYRCFTDNFIQRLNSEMVHVVAEAKQNRILDLYAPSNTFKTRMVDRVKNTISVIII